MYRLRRIPRSVSLFLSFTVDGEGSMLHLLYRSCLSLSLPLRFSWNPSRVYTHLTTSWLGASEPRLGNRFLRCANRRWLKIKAPRILSLFRYFTFAPRSFSLLPVPCPSRRRIFRRLLSHERCTRARIDRTRRAFDYERSNRARGRSTIAFTTCHRYLSTDQDGVRGKLLPDTTPTLFTPAFRMLLRCSHVRNVTLTSAFLLRASRKLLDNFFGPCLTKVRSSKRQ